jgi:hypothetical protein
MDEKLTELVRKCDELYDMSNKKYSDSVWKDTLWGQTGDHSFSILSDDRFKASSKTIPPHSAI